MARNHKSTLATDDWTTPCGNYTIDLARVRLHQDRGHYENAGKLLQAMARNHKSTLATDDWTTPCGNHTIDLARVRLHQDRGHYENAGKLLQAMAVNHKSTLAPDDWTTPCGNHIIDLARVRLHREKRDYNTFDALAKSCILTYPARPEYSEVYLIGLGEQKKWQTFDETIDSIRNEDQNTLFHSKNIQHALSVRYFQEALCLYGEKKNKKGEELCKRALGVVESVRIKYPSFASALSQQAHCLRLLGREESEWGELFRRANIIDPERMKREKRDPWRAQEHKVLEALGCKMWKREPGSTFQRM